MRKTNFSKKISLVNYFISALANLEKGTNTNKLLLKIWLLSSTFTFIVSTIALSMIGTLTTETIFIKVIIYMALFGISSILPSILFILVYYTSILVEKLNLFLNLLYLICVGEIKLNRYIYMVISMVKREFRLSNKEIKLYNKEQKTKLDKIINSFYILKEFDKWFFYCFFGKKEINPNLIHTHKILIYIVSIVAVLFIAFNMYYLPIENDFYTLSFLSIALYFAYTLVLVVTLFSIFLILKFIQKLPQIIHFILNLPKYIYGLFLKIVETIKLFFKEMKEEYQGSKGEINKYIQERVNE